MRSLKIAMLVVLLAIGHAALCRGQDISELQKLAQSGDANGQFNLGYIYANGIGVYANGQGVAQDYAQAVSWYRKAADQGYAHGQNYLGLMYANGQGVAKDYVQAVSWYRKAADQGDANGQANLGVMYASGRGVAQDDAQAASWYRKAADQGDAKGQLGLGVMYENGRGVAQDFAQARLWLKKAAEHGFTPAKDELAKLDASLPARNDAPAVPARSDAPAVPSRRTTSDFATVPIPHNYALIFAADQYMHWPHLTNPVSDADAVSRALSSLYGFHVDEVLNPTSDQVLSKLREYLHRKFEPQDQLIILFSGHGYFDNELGQGFIVPADALMPREDPAHRSLLAYDDIMHYVNRIPSNHIVLIADACFAGTLDRKLADSSLRGDPSDFYVHATLPELLARKANKRTRRYLASGGKDFVPDGLPGHHSPFVSAFLVTLNQAADRKGYLTLDDIQQGLDTVTPEPRWGDIEGDNEPGADFLLLTPSAVAQLSKPN